MKSIKKSICIILALISILALNACGGNSGGENKEPETYPPAKVMTIERIIDDYEENSLRAEETHMGQRYKCNAQVVSVNEDYVYARVWAGHISLYYNSDQKDFVMNLSQNDVITFEGTFTEIRIGSSYYGGMDFEDVIFVEKLYNNGPNHIIED
ncbi:MAG: hypothetical protein UHK54_09510 [Acutalibacteraceae bacterium]|nr:hypothetical protein [Acutalibacteraceae bacterium]